MHYFYDLINMFLSARSYQSMSTTVLGGKVDAYLATYIPTSTYLFTYLTQTLI